VAVEARVHVESVGGAGVLHVAADYVSLLKPRIILLLLVTELGAMIVAARGWPGGGVTLGSLLGGALAAVWRRCDQLLVRSTTSTL